jgi:hypothetical protein
MVSRELAKPLVRSCAAIKFLTKLAKNRVAEINNLSNQFTTYTLLGKHLVIITEVERLGEVLIEICRKLIGRDTINMEEKYKTAIQAIPYCQLIITTNKKPDLFPNLYKRPEIRTKIVALEFNNAIPIDSMVSTLDEFLNQHIVEYFLWSVFTPRNWLDQQIRAGKMINYQIINNLLKPTEMQAYIQERLVVPNLKESGVYHERSYVIKDELKADYEQWILENGEQSSLGANAKYSLDRSASNLITELNSFFGLAYTPNEIREQRLRLPKNKLVTPTKNPKSLAKLTTQEKENIVESAFKALSECPNSKFTITSNF